MRTRLAALLLTLAPLALLAASPARAIEVAAYTPDPSLLPARQADASAVARRRSALPRAGRNPGGGRRAGARPISRPWRPGTHSGGKPTRVGFARALCRAARAALRRFVLRGRLGQRVGGRFPRSQGANGNWVWGTSVEVGEAKALRLELAEVEPACRNALLGLQHGRRGALLRPAPAARRRDPHLTDDRRRSHLSRGRAAGRAPDSKARDSASGACTRSSRSAAESAASFDPEADDCLQNGECFDSGDFPGHRQRPRRRLPSTSTWMAGLRLHLLRRPDSTTRTRRRSSRGSSPPITASTSQASAPSRWTRSSSVAISAAAARASTFVSARLGADLIVTSESHRRHARPGAGSHRRSRRSDLSRLDEHSPSGRHSPAPPLASGARSDRAERNRQNYSTHQLDETPAFQCGDVVHRPRTSCTR